MFRKSFYFTLIFMLVFSAAFAEKDLNRSLLDAAKEGKTERIKELLAKGADINARSKGEGITPLMAAMFTCDSTLIKLLIQRGADVNAEDREGGTALTAASFLGCQAGATLLLENGAKPNCSCRSSYTLDIEASIEDKLTPLMLASIKGHGEMVRLLLDKGAKIEAKTTSGYSALTYAVLHGQLDIVKMLIKNEANIHDTYEKGKTLLMKTIGDQKNHLKMAKLLIESGIEVDARDEFGGTALIYAAAYGNFPDLLKCLIDHGADVNAKSKGGFTALMGAAGMGLGEVVTLLIKNGADIHAKNKEGKTALDIAEELNKHEIAELLKNRCVLDEAFSHRCICFIRNLRSRLPDMAVSIQTTRLRGIHREVEIWSGEQRTPGSCPSRIRIPPYRCNPVQHCPSGSP